MGDVKSACALPQEVDYNQERNAAYWSMRPVLVLTRAMQIGAGILQFSATGHLSPALHEMAQLACMRAVGAFSKWYLQQRWHRGGSQDDLDAQSVSCAKFISPNSFASAMQHECSKHALPCRLRGCGRCSPTWAPPL